MKKALFAVFLVGVLTACTPVVTSVSTETAPSTGGLSLTSTLTPVMATPSPLSTQLTVPMTLDPVQEEQQGKIKNVLQMYFDLRYQALSVSPPEGFQVNGFGDLVSNGPDAKDFLITEMAKLAVERKWYELNRLRHAKYEYSLTYKDIVVDAFAKTATVSLLEDFTIVDERAMERNPEKPNTTRGNQTHEIVLRNEQDQWKIVSDIYWDAWWRSYRKPGMSTDEILNKIDIETNTMEASPSLESSHASIATEFSCNFGADASSHPYDRNAAVAYAQGHALSYNPNYPDYTGEILGGDCTNFISQSIYEGGNASMWKPPGPLPPPSDQGQSGWYLLNDKQRASAWNHVGGSPDTYAFYDFVIENGVSDYIDEGPEGCVMTYSSPEELAEQLNQIMAGDVIQYQ